MQNHYWRIFYRNLIIFYCAWTQYTKKVFYVTQTPLKKITLPRLYYLVPLVLITKTITTTRSWNSWQDQNNLKQCCTVRPLVGWRNFYDEKGRYTRTRVWYINYKKKLNLNGCYHYFLKFRENKRFTVQHTNSILFFNFYICDTIYVNRKG